MIRTWLPILAAAALLQPSANADVTYQETTKITGGSLKSMLKIAGAFSAQARVILVLNRPVLIIALILDRPVLSGQENVFSANGGLNGSPTGPK
jgi:hypothetical protein